MKIVINSCYGGFGLSDEALECLECEYSFEYDDRRTDPALISVVENLGELASGFCSSLQVVEIPDEATDWELNNYDGVESITYVIDGKLRHMG